MPIYEYRCENMHVTADLVSFDRRRPSLTCRCGLDAPLVPSLPGVKPGTWFDKESTGLDGVYDDALGCHIRSPEHRKQVCDERGLIPVSDVGERWDDWKRKKSEEAKASDDYMRTYLQDLETGPESAQLKTARDNGLVPDWSWAVDAVGGLDAE